MAGAVISSAFRWVAFDGSGRGIGLEGEIEVDEGRRMESKRVARREMASGEISVGLLLEVGREDDNKGVL